MKLMLKLMVVVALCLVGSNKASAQGLIGNPIIIEQDASVPPAPVIPTKPLGKVDLPPYQLAINSRLNNSLLAYPKFANQPALVTVFINKTGEVNPQQIVFSHSTGVLESDFACVDSILSSMPFDPPLTSNAWNNEYAFYGDYVVGKVTMSNNVISTTNFDLVNTYFKAHPRLLGKVLLTRSIPRSVLYFYPGVFKAEEIDTVDNVKALKKELFDSALEKSTDHTFAKFVLKDEVLARYIDWAKFEKEHKDATKKEILDEEQKLNSKYSQLFEL
jgi:hypothetical protein